MKIAIIGCGAMGSVYAALLADSGNEVWAIDTWEDHISAINRNGLRVEGASGDRTVSINATTDPRSAGECELIIVATKASGVAAAAAGTLAFMCGGGASAFTRARPILEGMGSAEKIFHAGPAGAGQVAKAANNMLLAIHMVGTCEALAMGEAHGLDPAVCHKAREAADARPDHGFSGHAGSSLGLIHPDW